MHKRSLFSLALVAVVAIIATVVLGGLSAFAATKPTLTFTTPARTSAAGASSETITVALSSGFTGPAEVKLTSSSATGVFRNAADTANVTKVTIESGQTQVSFRYRDTVAGSPTITATASSTAAKAQWNGNVSETQAETVVAAALDHMTLAPSSATVSSGTGQAYTATGFDQYNNSRGNVTAGTTFSIAPNGSCTGASCQAALAGTHTVTGTNGSVSANATLTVTGGPVDHLVLSPASGSIAAGESKSYKAEGYDAAGNDLGDYTSKATFTVAPDGSCEGASCQATVAGSHTVTAAAGSAKGEASLSVKAAGLDHLQISPSSATVSSGGSQSYTATGLDKYGNSLGDVTPQTTFAIAPDGSCEGASCHASLAGSHTVTGTDGAATGGATLNVSAGPLDHLTVAPASSSIAAGESKSYKAEGYDAAGNDLGDYTSKATFTVAPDGSCEGASCQATVAGSHTVTASVGSIEAKAVLDVKAGAVAKIAISPQSATIDSGGSQAFTVEGSDAYGNDVGDVTSEASFGISPDGSCAGASCGATEGGDHTVKATIGSLSSQTTLHVRANAPTAVSITFDDGSADQLEGAQILDEHGMDATFFIVSGRVGNSGVMNLGDLEGLAAAGHEIADHTVNHLNLLNVNHEEAERQICNARVQLENWGFHVWDFAYPQGGTNAELEEIAANCNLNSARAVSNLVSPGTCEGCAWAETVPPRDPYKIQTPDSIKATTSLEEIEGLVKQAQSHGGGWVPLVFHHVCDGCDSQAVSPATLAAFASWLESEAGNGVAVKTMHEVIGGEDKPLVSGPAAPVRTGSLLENPSLETDLNANETPDCWTVGGSGANTFEASRSSDAHSGSYAEKVAISSFESGDRRLTTTQDLGQCAPAASPTHTYTASAYLKGEGTMRWVAYLRNEQGGWSFWAQSPNLTAGSAYGQSSWTTPQAPSWATAISVGISLRSVGSLTADDFLLEDNGATDQTPPAVSLASPAGGSTVEGTTYINADATDNRGIASVRFYLDGTSMGSKTSPTTAGGSTYQWKWDTTTASVGSHTLSAVATDVDGNQTSSAPVTVTVQRDTTAPTTTIQCNGSSSCGGWLKSPVSVTLKASDNVAVASTYYTTDGSEPTASNGTLYSGAFNVSAPAEVRYRSVDTEGNWEATHSQSIQVDGQAPTSAITAPANGATVVRTSTVGILDEATDNVSIASVRFYLDGVSLGSKTTPTTTGGSTYKWNWETTGVSEGTHTLTAVATDAAGNQTTSTAVTVTVVADTTAPTTSILCNGSSACGGWFKAAVSVTLPATDNGVLAGTYYTTDGSEPSASNGTLYNGAFTVPATATVKYRSVDAAGNWEATHSQPIQVDSQGPATKITNPANGATVSGVVGILAEATDNVSIASVRFYLDGVSLGSKTTPTVTGGSTYKWNWETASATKGTHTLTVVATDQAGNQTTSAPITVTVG